MPTRENHPSGAILYRRTKFEEKIVKAVETGTAVQAENEVLKEKVSVLESTIADIQKKLDGPQYGLKEAVPKIPNEGETPKKKGGK